MKTTPLAVGGRWRTSTSPATRTLCLSDSFASVQCGPSFLTLENAGNVFLTCGPEGKIAVCSGPPVVGPLIQMTPSSLKLSVGPPGVGASIELSATGIDLKFGLTEFKLNAMGIEDLNDLGKIE